MSQLPVGSNDLLELVTRAGAKILEWYGVPAPVDEKSDGSPFTLADRAAHTCLAGGLVRLAPAVPVISEESPPEARRTGGDWERYWLVDPLDGTKEFLRGTGEFTVNVALIERGRPVFGIVHAPALGVTYRATSGRASEKAGADGHFRQIRTRRFDAAAPVLVRSRDHAGPAVERLTRRLGRGVEFTSMGSSLKFCLVAEGRADLYLRDQPTMGWDTAAAQCVVENAGGQVFALDQRSAAAVLRYDGPTLLNPQFCCVGDPEGPWGEFVRRARDEE